MIAADNVAAVLLAAGSAARFGGGKLDALLHGVPVGLGAFAALAGQDWRSVAIVVPPEPPDFVALAGPPPPLLLINRAAADGMASSVRLAAAHAAQCGAAGLLLLLADMPLVSPDTVAALLAAQDGASPRAASAMRQADGGPGPPALFGAGWFAPLQQLEGDSGARRLLRAAAQDVAIVDRPAAEWIDIDRIADLTMAAGLRRS